MWRISMAVGVLVAAASCGRFGFDATDVDEADASSSSADAIGTAETVIGERNGAIAGLTIDTTIKDYDATVNFESAGFIGAYAPLDGSESTPGLVRFDLSSLSGRTVVSAELDIAINLNVDTTFEGETIAAARILESWVGSEVTFNERSAGVPWASPGATGAARGAVIGEVETTAGDTVATLPLAAGAVQPWLTTPSANAGFILVAIGDDGRGAWLASSEYPDEDRRPVLRLQLAP